MAWRASGSLSCQLDSDLAEAAAVESSGEGIAGVIHGLEAGPVGCRLIGQGSSFELLLRR